MNEEVGGITFDRALYSATHYPTEYGLVPGTRSSDGEMLDALIMVERPTFSGCLTEMRVLGVLTISHTCRKQEAEALLNEAIVAFEREVAAASSTVRGFTGIRVPQTRNCTAKGLLRDRSPRENCLGARSAAQMQEQHDVRGCGG